MITVVVGKEIEKIKGDFESVINGMNMVGNIPYDVYSELFDVGTDYIQKAYELGRSELEKENTELKEEPKKNHWYEMYELECLKTKELEVQLAKAKELIEDMYDRIPASHSDYYKDVMEKAKQFLIEE